MVGLTGSQRQFEMLQLYGALASAREEWAGELVLAFGAHADLVPVAVSVAGGASLVLEEDGEVAKVALRRGEVDFVVNTVDEALRALKNQIRQRKPLGVAVVGSVAACLAELTSRGVTPAWILQGSLSLEHQLAVRSDLDMLRLAGARYTLLMPNGTERWIPSWEALGGKRFYAWHVQPRSMQELRAADRELLSNLPAEDHVRRRWLERLPRYVRDSVEAGRWVWLTKDEVDALPDTMRISPEERLECPPTTP